MDSVIEEDLRCVTADIGALCVMTISDTKMPWLPVTCLALGESV